MKSSKEIKEKIDRLEEKYKKALNREKVEELSKAPTGKLVYFRDAGFNDHLFVKINEQYVKLPSFISEVKHNFYQRDGLICGGYFEFEISDDDIEFIGEYRDSD